MPRKKKEETIETLANGKYGYNEESMKIKAGHLIWVTKRIDIDGSVESAIDILNKESSDLIDPRIDLEYEYNYGESYSHLNMSGWQEMNEKQLKLAEHLRNLMADKRKVADALNLDNERTRYLELKKKFENDGL